MFETAFFPDDFILAFQPEQDMLRAHDVLEGDAVFVSGKLMDPQFVRQVVGRYLPFSSAIAIGFERGERGEGENKVLLLERKRDAIVLGILLLKITPDDLILLDAFEQVPSVRERVKISVIIGSLQRTAYTFLPR
jgi:hypothetical protein